MRNFEKIYLVILKKQENLFGVCVRSCNDFADGI